MPKTPPEIKLFILLGSFLISIVIILVMLDEKNLKGEEETGDVHDGYWVYPFDSGELYEREGDIDAVMQPTDLEFNLDTVVHTKKSKVGGHGVKSKEVLNRGKWQKAMMKHFCSKLKKTHKHQYEETVLKHLIFDDKHKVIYCYVPKAGCTMMKTMFLILQGLFSLEVLEKAANVTHKDYLSMTLSLCSSNTDSINCDTPESEIKYKLQTYFKFMIVRNPLERFFSAFHEKLTATTTTELYQSMQKFVLRYSSDYQSRFPNFPQFVDAFLETDELNDHHFLPMVEICDPCMIEYDFYASFSSLNHDISGLLHMLKIPQEYYFNNIKHPQSLIPRSSHYNASLVTGIYRQLDPSMREVLLRRFSEELDFFRTVYPEQSELLDEITLTNEKL